MRAIDNCPNSLRILAAPGVDPIEGNPYTRLLYQHMEAQVESFSYWRAFRTRFDIVHVHWPEWELNVWKNPITVVARLSLKLAAIDTLRARGARLVWTIHNLKSHDGVHPRIECWYWNQFVNRLDGYIALSHAGLKAAQERFPALQGLPGFVIPHGHYRGEYRVDRDVDARKALGLPLRSKVILFFGRICPYKNVGALICGFRRAALADAVLIVAGQPSSAELAAELELLAAGDSRIRLEMTTIPIDSVQRYFAAADLVALPYRDILNSGTALLALSFDCPVLVPRRGAMSELAQEIGPKWVRTYVGELTEVELIAALDWAVQTRDPAAAPLDHLEWPLLSRKTESSYATIVNRKR